MAAKNLYPANCSGCTKRVHTGAGFVQWQHTGRGRRGGHFNVYCKPCFEAKEADNSGVEDRQCGDLAYEDACARACGL